MRKPPRLPATPLKTALDAAALPPAEAPSPARRPKAAASGKRPKMRRRARTDPERVEEIFRRFAAASPEPKGELEHVDPFTLLVAVVLSAQATDAGVNKATRGLFKVASTPGQMVALGEGGVTEHIKTIGLYRNKARNVIALSERLIAEHGGEVPRERGSLEALPGVGRKTANVVLNIAFGEPTLAVDTHVFRVAHRLGLAEGKTPLDVELGLLKVIPGKYMRHAHHWLILHG
ncbi:MAG TPA: endonuclease III, partial [Hyphomicrobiaceae bacterium]|nr:endonuclease III [Hyphomicrobiaceae bacterium]